jgi:hypothetical protein
MEQGKTFLRLGRLSRSRVAMARLRTFRLRMCISSRHVILFTCGNSSQLLA